MIQAEKEMTFGGWLRKRRRELDLTQQALADRVGCTRITLRRLEAGTLKPSEQLAEMLLKLLGIPDLERPLWVRFARGLANHPAAVQFPPKTNLPAQLTSFIGRKKDISEIKDALSKYRLVTLTGSGGVGKTRLSLQVAADLLNSFPDGVWLVELATISSPSLLPQILQNVLGLIEQKDTTALQSLQEFLKEKKVLLILDNCEHLIDACATLVFDLLSGTTHLKILASSREALDVHGEFSWRLPSLSTPDKGLVLEADQLSRYEAVKLFIERARLIDSKFAVDKTNASAVAQICSRLDGIPLAIELAAARLKSLNVEQIHARLDDRFNLLTNGARTVLPRHQTLRATIDWSYNSLSESEKTIFRRLAVFTGGWRLEAAESICAGNEIAREDVIDLITGLMQKSLIHTVELPRGNRYEQLETIRQYGQEKFLASVEVDLIRDQHLQYYVELAKQAEPELHSSAQVPWFNHLGCEMSNLRTALARAKTKDKTAFLQLASSLWSFFGTFEHKHEGLAWLSQAVAENKDARTSLLSTVMARLSYLYLYISTRHEQTEGYEGYAATVLDLCREVNNKPAEALALISLAGMELERMDGKLGSTHIEQALDIARELQDHWLIATALIHKAKFAQLKNQREGLVIFEEALQEAQLSGDKRLISTGLFWVFINLLATGELVRAKEVAQERIAVASAIDDKDGIIYSHNSLGVISLYEDDYLSSEEHAETVIRLSKSCNHDSGLLHGLGNAALANLAMKNLPRALELTTEMERLILSKGSRLKTDLGYHVFLRIWVYILDGNLERIRTHAKELITIYKDDNNIILSIEYFRIFATLACMGGRHQAHVTLASVVTKLHERVVIAYFDYPFMSKLRAEQLAKSREALGEETFNKAWEAGRMLTLEDAKEYALGLINK